MFMADRMLSYIMHHEAFCWQLEHIAKMKELAEKGRGLNTYINQHVRKNYETKET